MTTLSALRKIEWPPRARYRVLNGGTGRASEWRSVCGRYMVQALRSYFGLPTRYRALVVSAGYERCLSEHRRRAPALRACERHARTQTLAAGNP